MRLLKLIPIWLFVAITSGLLIFPGCSDSYHEDSSYCPRVTGDGTGGAIILYEERVSHNQTDFYVQRISLDGKKLWGDKGTMLNNSYTSSSSFYYSYICSDGTGGAIVYYLTYLKNPNNYLYHICKIDSSGQPVWQKELDQIDQIISDGNGGAIAASVIVTYDKNNTSNKNIQLIKIDAQGSLLWGEKGVLLQYLGIEEKSLKMVTDNKGGAIVIWQERQDVQVETGKTVSLQTRNIAQKINSQGELAWIKDGVVLYNSATATEYPEISEDGLGGVVIIWQRAQKELYLQKLDAGGNLLWDVIGVPLKITDAVKNARPNSPNIIADVEGKSIVFWGDSRDELESIYAQKIDTNGTVKWQLAGMKVLHLNVNSSFDFRAPVSDGNGGAYIPCSSEKGLYLQKIDSNGKAIWQENGFQITSEKNVNGSIACDGQGGVIISWGNMQYYKSNIQRFDATGEILWGIGGIPLN